MGKAQGPARGKVLRRNTHENASQTDIAGFALGGEAGSQQECFMKPLQRDGSLADGIVERGGRGLLELAMNVLVVERVDRCIEKQLEVRDVPHGLMGQFLDKPPMQRTVIGFDFAVGGRVTGPGVDAAYAKDAQSLTKQIGVIW